MKHLRLFSRGNLAMLSDWLAENGELYVNVYHPRTGDQGDTYLVRSLPDLKGLVLAQDAPEISITIYRQKQLALRGVVDDAFIEQALQTIADGDPYEIVGLDYWPRRLKYRGNGGTTHDELRRDLEANRGKSVAVGKEPAFSLAELRDLQNTFEAHIERGRNAGIVRNQDNYAPYRANPQQYQWINELWQKEGR